MKSRFLTVRPLVALCTLGLLLLAGCLEQNLVWSPDGQRAALLGADGLYLCDPQGQLTPLLVPGAYRVAWLGDSQQLVIARSHKTGAWPEIARALGKTGAAEVEERAEALWRQLQAGGLWSVLTMAPANEASMILTCVNLRERHGEALRRALEPKSWADLQDLRIELHALVLARREGGGLILGPVLQEGVGTIGEIRVAPGDRAVALVREEVSTSPGEKSRDRFDLFVALPTGAEPALVATDVARYPDWMPDGRTVAYMQASGPVSREELRLGTLVQREVLDAHGALAVRDQTADLAGWLFSDNTCVRSLRDGRLLFNAAEISLPVAAADMGAERDQLFALDPARQATLVRLVPRKVADKLPQSLAFFAVSPDESQVLFGDFNGQVSVLTLASGEVEQVQAPGKDNLQGQPLWRAPGEFSYTRRGADKAAIRKAEVVLRQAGKDRVLSRSWPDALVNHLFSEKR